MNIRKYRDSDWESLWPLLQSVIRSGETYPYPIDTTEVEAQKLWIKLPAATYIACNDENSILGTYYIKPNQPGLGAHVCNCGYMVSEQARGKGVASALCEHSQKIALQMGFKSMQFNLVVSTNETAVRLWKKLGFELIGLLPKAFNSQQHGYVDALVMYKMLQD